MRRRQGVADAARQRAESDDRKLGRCGQGAADQGTESKHERGFGAQRVDPCLRLVGQEPRTQTDASQKVPKHFLLERYA